MNATHSDLRIRGPLPMDVAGTLLAMIASAYPGAQVQTAAAGDALHVLIPNDQRPEDPELPEGLPLEVLRLDTTGLALSTPREVAAALTQVFEQVMVEHDPENYVELTIEVPRNEKDVAKYALVFARTSDQTPHQLRQEADRRLEEARARIAELKARLAAYET